MKNHLLIIDPQRDFHGGGSLPVPGADADSQRITDMIMNNMDAISQIFISLDTHHRNHISHAAFWLERSLPSDADNATATAAAARKPSSFTTITHKDVKDGKYLPVDKDLTEYCLHYTASLEARNRFTHMIFPEHCLIGSEGHAVVENIHRAANAWSTHHFKNIDYILKGQNCLTEMYSMIEAEVPVSTDPSTHADEKLLERLFETDRLIICGQALSHCVQYTVRDILKHWKKDKKAVVLLLDGSSSVDTLDSRKSAEEFVAEMTGLMTVCNVEDAFAAGL